MFSETSRYKKKKSRRKNLIFKYVVENTRLKKIIPNLYRQTNFFFEIEPREGTSICTVYGACNCGVYPKVKDTPVDMLLMFNMLKKKCAKSLHLILYFQKSSNLWEGTCIPSQTLVDRLSKNRQEEENTITFCLKCIVIA